MLAPAGCVAGYFLATARDAARGPADALSSARPSGRGRAIAPVAEGRGRFVTRAACGCSEWLRVASCGQSPGDIPGTFPGQMPKLSPELTGPRNCSVSPIPGTNLECPRNVLDSPQTRAIACSGHPKDRQAPRFCRVTPPLKGGV